MKITLDEIIQNINCRISGTLPSEFIYNSMRIDSRLVEKGDIFIAIIGQVRDGHNFIKDAIDRGAAAVIVAHEQLDISVPQIIVEKTTDTLLEIASVIRVRLRGKVIAVTGTVGKTTVKDAIAMALPGTVSSSYKNFNNYLGIPLSMANMDLDSDYVVVEIAIDRPGEMDYLANVVSPDISVFTNLTPVHMSNYKDLEQIASEKSRIFAYTSSGGTAVINGDMPNIDLIAGLASQNNLKVLRCGMGSSNDIVVKDWEVIGDDLNITYHIAQLNKDVLFNLRDNLESKWLQILGLVVALYVDLGLEVELLPAKFSHIKSPEGRGALLRLKFAGKDIVVIDDAYNASPASMLHALEHLSMHKKGRRIAILGDMGGFSDANGLQYYDIIGQKLATLPIEVLVTYGSAAKNIAKHIHPEQLSLHSDDVAEIAEFLRGYVQDGDTVLVKAALYTYLHKLIDKLRGVHANGTSLPRAYL